ncbi:hypothetical protein F4811DRAFT_314253 [Daldinia bambusicola]|nr:hypothetical protein F4811DRAFT_314253 [Daldinia bambusicola]
MLGLVNLNRGRERAGQEPVYTWGDRQYRTDATALIPTPEGVDEPMCLLVCACMSEMPNHRPPLHQLQRMAQRAVREFGADRYDGDPVEHDRYVGHIWRSIVYNAPTEEEEDDDDDAEMTDDWTTTTATAAPPATEGSVGGGSSRRTSIGSNVTFVTVVPKTPSTRGGGGGGSRGGGSGSGRSGGGGGGGGGSGSGRGSGSGSSTRTITPGKQSSVSIKTPVGRGITLVKSTVKRGGIKRPGDSIGTRYTPRYPQTPRGKSPVTPKTPTPLPKSSHSR